MIKKSFLFVLLSVLLVAVGLQVAAQEPGEYAGKYRFTYPGDYELTEGNGFLQLTSGESNINVYGPEGYARIIGGQTFDDNGAALEFFADRAGLEVSEDGATTEGLDGNQLAAVDVTLARRDQAGRAVMVDLQNDRKAVVVFLNGEGDEMNDEAMNALLDSLEYPADLVDVASTNPDFTTLVAAVQAAGLVDTLRDGEYTVFAPTNEAFERALKQVGMTAEELLADTETLTEILSYHVVEGRIASADLSSGWVATLSGDEVDVKVSRGSVRVNNARVITADVEAANGIIHVIDRVLLPPDVEATRLSAQFPTTFRRSTDYEGNFTFKYPTGAEVTEASNGSVTFRSGRAAVTVYGPQAYDGLVGSNEVEGAAERLAFFLDRLNAYEVGEAVAELPENAAAGISVSVPRFNQTGTAYLVDLQNGRTGVVIALAQRDGYSLAYRDFGATTALASFVYPEDIVDVAMDKPELSTLVTAIEAAGLTETLRDKSASYTVFAPSNDAFGAFLASTNMSVEDVVANTELLTSILTYHVVPSAVMSADLVDGPVDTVNGVPVTISLGEGSVMVNDANVVEADIEAANGVIHVIDKVLMPPPACVITDTRAAVRTGPSSNNAIAVYLGSGVETPVIGQVMDASGALWYQVDPAVAAPGKQMIEAWVLSTEVTSTGAACAAAEDAE